MNNAIAGSASASAVIAACWAMSAAVSAELASAVVRLATIAARTAASVAADTMACAVSAASQRSALPAVVQHVQDGVVAVLADGDEVGETAVLGEPE